MALAQDFVGLLRYSFPVGQEIALPQDLIHNGAYSEKGYRYHLVHLWKPMDAQVREALVDHGLEIVSYIPENTFVVRLHDGVDLDSAPFVDWHGLWHPAYKIHPNLEGFQLRGSESGSLDITLHRGARVADMVARVIQLGGRVLHTVDAYPLARVTAHFSDLQLVGSVAHLEDVCWIAPVGERRVRNDQARWLVQSYEGPGVGSMATPLYDHGLHGEGEVLGLIDETVDVDHCMFTDSEGDPVGPNHRKLAYFESHLGPSDHGTHVAGTLAGSQEDSLDGAGIAHEARIAFTLLPGNQSENLFNILSNHQSFGAAIHSNSWGENLGTAVDRDYTTDCADADNYSYLNENDLVIFACWNDSSFPLTPVLSPENALNVLAVGATEAGSVDSELLSERHGSCAIGPVPLDLRRKPEIFAPGFRLSSAAHNTACDQTLKGGTSMATPVVAGSAALIRQYFREGMYPFGRRLAGRERIPTGALLKAMLLVGSVDMAEETESPPGTYIDSPIPNSVEGWGRLNLDNGLYFPGDTRRLLVKELRNAEGLETDDVASYTVRTTNDHTSLHVCMVFTQPPGTPGTLTPVSNDLDLRVTSPTGVVYRGNFFGGGASLPDGSPDPRNNVEMVRLPVPEPGLYTIEVHGTAVNMGPQGFSLAITGPVIPGDCADVEIDAGADIDLACWGDSVVLGQALEGLDADVTWSPADGLSDPNAAAPIATPQETTTYTVTATLPGGCLKTDMVTITVPPMDIDESGTLDSDDLLQFLPLWGSSSPDLTRDYTGEGLLEVRDLITLLNCAPN